MKIRITESQYRTLVNKPRDVVFGKINEGGKPKETPEEIDAKIEEILNHVRNGGEFIRNRAKDDYYKWLYNKKKSDKTEEQKFQNALNQIKEIKIELENEKIEEILNHVKNGGEFKRDNKDNNYLWLYSKILYDKTGKFQNGLDQITKIQEELENKKIEQILNHVKNGGEFTRDTYIWFHNNKKSDKTGKFQNVLDQIYEIQKKLGKLREWWGEKAIRDTLENLGFKDIPRQGQHTYKDCKNSLTCKFYKFDIFLPYNENNYMVGKNEGFYIPETGIIFEYDGKQHFQSNEYFGGEEEFRKRINSDKEKNSYCQNNNIKLVRISYTTKTYHEINHEVFYGLKSKNTNGNIITTGNYPQLGWNQK
jgi:hypothetical protein